MTSKYTSLKDPEFKGYKTPRHLKDGPVDKRGCTDCLCLLIFTAFWVGMLFMGFYGFQHGHPERLIAPYDMYRNPCGLGSQADYPYAYWIKEEHGFIIPNVTVCVKSCPLYSNSTIECAPDFEPSVCRKIFIYETNPFAGKLCLPQDIDLYKNLTQRGALAADFIQKSIADLKTTWWVVLVVVLIALLLGFAYMFLMRSQAGVMTWSLIIMYFIALVGFGALCYFGTNNPLFEKYHIQTLSSLSNFDDSKLKIVAFICWGLAAVSLIALCFTCGKIELAISILKCASEFVDNVTSILVTPLIFLTLTLLFYLFWIFGAAYVVGLNEITRDDSGPFAQITWSNSTITMSLYFLFGLFWNHAFLAGMSQFVIISACCIWYFSRANRKRPEAPVSKSLFRGVVFHLGSIAMGSFAIAVLGILRVIMSYFEGQMRAARESTDENCCSKYCLTCSNFCLSCFERFVKFINDHAYVQIAMTGESFCQATQDAFYLLLRNAGRFGIVNGLGFLFVFVGQLFITFAATFAGYLIITRSDHFTENLYSPVAPTIVFFVLSLMIGHIFMSVYGVSADTIIHCYCMDEEIHDRQPNYAPEALKGFLEQGMLEMR